ncbi:MAG: hypothetical protein JNM89_07815 [Hyphomicrobiaceae bacterium]|nr:hypothetical protein [Hyphomicrobiaceae bacterium]
MAVIAGLDVGGAHLKVALVEDGRVRAVEQFLCPLWQGLDKLDAAFAAARPLLARADRCAVTMTGELSDLFETREAGVATLVDRIGDTLGSEVSFWLGSRGMGRAGDALAHPADVGSTNFLATASVVARQHREAVLLDLGSTTADIVPVSGHKPAACGLTDWERQRTGELVYTGFTRTAVMGVANRVPFKGEWTTLAREYLATMADVRRILGELDERCDLHATADGRGKSVKESVARFARMLGREAADGDLADWQAAARTVAELQMRSIHDGLLLVLSRTPEAARGPLVAAGIGAEVAAAVALRAGMDPLTFGEMIGAQEEVRRAATHSAPAVAVALLATT